MLDVVHRETEWDEKKKDARDGDARMWKTDADFISSTLVEDGDVTNTSLNFFDKLFDYSPPPQNKTIDFCGTRKALTSKGDGAYSSKT